MSPEVAIGKAGRRFIAQFDKKLATVAIDESHCVEEW